MRRLLLPIRLSCFLWAATWFAVSPAYSASPADAVPESASIVVKWKTPQASAGKVADFVDAVQPGFGTFVRSALPTAGQLIGISGLQGVDLDQDILAVVFAESQVSPTVVYIITAKDVEAVQKALSTGDYEVHTQGKLVAYSEDKESLDEIIERLADKGKSLWPKIDAASMKTFQDGDLSVIFNVKQLTEDFADELKGAESQIDNFIDQITSVLPDDQQQQMASIFEIYRHLGKTVISGLNDTNSFAVGLTFTKESIRYEDRLQVIDGSPTAAFLASQPAADLSLINKLPGNKAVYVGSKFDMSSMVEWSMKMTKGMMTNLTAEQSSQFDAAVKEMSGLKFGEMAMYLDLSDTSPALRTGTVSSVKPIDRMREITRILTKCMSDIQMPNLKQTTTMENNVAKIGGVEVDRITVKQEFENPTDPFGIQKKLQAALFGDAGMQQYVMYQADRVLQTMGGTTADLQALVNSLESTRKNESAVTATRKRFADKSNVVALLDLSRLIVSGLQLAGEQTTLPFDTNTLANVEFEPSFLGYTLSFEPSAVRSQLDIPVIQFQNIAKIVTLVQPQR